MIVSGDNALGALLRSEWRNMSVARMVFKIEEIIACFYDDIVGKMLKKEGEERIPRAIYELVREDGI